MQVYSVIALDASDPYTVTLDSPYGDQTQLGCELFRHGNLASGVSGYQYIITFDSNVGDLPALTVDGSGLWESNGGDGNETRAEVRRSRHFWTMLYFLDLVMGHTLSLVHVRAR